MSLEMLYLWFQKHNMRYFFHSTFSNAQFVWIFSNFSEHFHMILKFSCPSGTRGFENRVRVYRVWIIWQKIGFGFNGFAKNRSKPVGFSGSGKPDPPLLHMQLYLKYYQKTFLCWATKSKLAIWKCQHKSCNIDELASRSARWAFFYFSPLLSC